MATATRRGSSHQGAFVFPCLERLRLCRPRRRRRPVTASSETSSPGGCLIVGGSSPGSGRWSDCQPVPGGSGRSSPIRTSPRASAGDGLPLLLDLCCFPAQVTQVVQLRPPYVAPSHDLYLVDDRRMYRERALHANPEADLADRERLTQPAALPPDDDALEHLHAG